MWKTVLSKCAQGCRKKKALSSAAEVSYEYCGAHQFSFHLSSGFGYPITVKFSTLILVPFQIKQTLHC